MLVKNAVAIDVHSDIFFIVLLLTVICNYLLRERLSVLYQQYNINKNNYNRLIIIIIGGISKYGPCNSTVKNYSIISITQL